jgi:hypothetical protein
MTLEAFSVGLEFPKGMPIARATELAKEACDFATGSCDVVDEWDSDGKNRALLLLEIDHEVMWGRNEYRAEKDGVVMTIEMP